MKNTILLTRNFEKYRSGYYHNDLVEAIKNRTNCFIYGPGYEKYSSVDTFNDVIRKSGFNEDEIDLVFCSTSWDDDKSIESVDPHPKICLKRYTKFKKIYFLNKEYKKLSERFAYIKKNKFDLVCTVHPDASKWEKELNVKFMYLPFGISLKRFNYRNQFKDIDFGFSGSLHAAHTDHRYFVKKQLFNKNKLSLNSNKGLNGLFSNKIFKDDFSKLNIFWAEWGAKDFFGKSLLPTGKNYANLLARSKVFLNTPSAIGIFNTRFFELMASKSLIICPKEGEYDGILEDNKNCVMYEETENDFKYKLMKAIKDNAFREKVVNQAFKDAQNNSYNNRVDELLDFINANFI